MSTRSQPLRVEAGATAALKLTTGKLALQPELYRAPGVFVLHAMFGPVSGPKDVAPATVSSPALRYLLASGNQGTEVTLFSPETAAKLLMEAPETYYPDVDAEQALLLGAQTEVVVTQFSVLVEDDIGSQVEESQ